MVNFQPHTNWKCLGDDIKKIVTSLIMYPKNMNEDSTVSRAK